jgi:hypothetical protein
MRNKDMQGEPVGRIGSYGKQFPAESVRLEGNLAEVATQAGKTV